jgi:exopolysaccharide biosynthesis protein
MQKLKVTWLLGWYLACFWSVSTKAQPLFSADTLPWKKETLAPGLVHFSVHTPLAGTQQHIQVLLIDLRQRTVSIYASNTVNQPTSVLAQKAGALAAINAGFFDMRQGGSVTFLKQDGQVTNPDTARWKSNNLLNSALLITRKGKVQVGPIGSYDLYARKRKYDDVLVTGPMLRYQGATVQMSEGAFVHNQHPRTCVGILDKHHVLLVTADGRHQEAAGMSLPELAELMHYLGCRHALNLDGGGSTTMWLQGKTPGVVNRPSDNKKFDHEGERPVANILAVF